MKTEKTVDLNSPKTPLSKDSTDKRYLWFTLLHIVSGESQELDMAGV